MVTADFGLTDQRLEDLPGLAAPAEAGAVVAFWGRVRNHNEGRRVTGLEYSAYEALALKEGRLIIEEAGSRFGLEAVRAVHRVGPLAVGDAAVVVEVAAGHRGEAFEACRWIIDEIKARVPIWKQECYVDAPAESDKEWLANAESRREPT